MEVVKAIDLINKRIAELSKEIVEYEKILGFLEDIEFEDDIADTGRIEKT